MEAARNTALEFDALRACVLVPTYNNERTLPAVLDAVLAYTPNVIVVNDGSTDGTAALLAKYPDLDVVDYADNHGKGYALRRGFELAAARGFDYAISIDSDGQHYASDLPAFLARARQSPGALVIGARNMDQASVPGKSSFGHKFSNFWFRLETGIDAPDTQSGYRLYPVQRLRGMRWFTRKYEFEIEVIVRAAWKGIPVESIPVRVYYPPPGERISHFRPFRDFTRISILNTFLVLATFLWIKPRDFFRGLFDRRKWKDVLLHQILDVDQSDARKAFSCGFGVFMGIVPIWGFQLIAGIFLAVLFRLNKALVVLFAHVSIPPMIPLVVYASYRTGAWWMTGKPTELALSHSINLSVIRYNFRQYLAGSITLAVAAGLATGLVVYLLLKIAARRKISLS